VKSAYPASAKAPEDSVAVDRQDIDPEHMGVRRSGMFGESGQRDPIDGFWIAPRCPSD